MNKLLCILAAFAEATQAPRTCRDVCDVTGFSMALVSNRVQSLWQRGDVRQVNPGHRPLCWRVTDAGLRRLEEGGQPVAAARFEEPQGEQLTLIESALRSRRVLELFWRSP